MGIDDVRIGIGLRERVALKYACRWYRSPWRRCVGSDGLGIGIRMYNAGVHSIRISFDIGVGDMGEYRAGIGIGIRV